MKREICSVELNHSVAQENKKEADSVESASTTKFC